MSATVIDLRTRATVFYRKGDRADLTDIAADLADIGIDVTVTGRDLCYSNTSAVAEILRANHKALGQAIEQLDAWGER